MTRRLLKPGMTMNVYVRMGLWLLHERTLLILLKFSQEWYLHGLAIRNERRKLLILSLGKKKHPADERTRCSSSRNAHLHVLITCDYGNLNEKKVHAFIIKRAKVS